MTKITKKPFGKTASGADVELYTLDNGSMALDVMTYGGTVVALRVPDKDGALKDVALGYETVGEYEKNGGFLGALIGRCGNRIERGVFELGGKTYHLYCNDGLNHLHGGKIGFDKRMWTAEVVSGETGEELKLNLFSADGDENYPGNLDVAVTYALTAENGLTISYRAVSDRDTVCNLTNHTYFNLGGQDSGKNICDHLVKLYADRYTVGNDETIPNGEIAEVAGTPYDFRDFHTIGERIDEPEKGLMSAGGYDHNWALNGGTEAYPIAAEVVCPTTGIKMTVYTDQPGLQFFCANGMSEKTSGKNGAKYRNHAGFCMETQCYPNAMKFPHFPSPVLKAGDVYETKTEYRFSIAK